MLSILFLAAISPLLADDSFLAGVAKTEITPTTYGPMYGYTNRKCGPAATGVHDPLFAKALVLQAGSTRMAIVTLDLGSIIAPNLRKRIVEQLNIPVVLLAASHSHSTPQYLDPDPAAAPSAYQQEMENKVFAAVEQASKAMWPAKIGVGRGEMRLGYNRVLLRDDGRARALFDNLERIPYGPVDPAFDLLRIDDAHGNPKALLVHYAVHAVVLGPTNCKYSADYPGVLQSKVEADLTGSQVMFVQGGAGDINPLFMARKGIEDEDFAVVKKMGELLAAEVLKRAKTIATKTPAKPSIASTSTLLTFKDRWSPEKTIEAGIGTVLINGEIAIAATPGEVFHRLQTDWKKDADIPYPLFYGYTYSGGGQWAGYVPDLRSAAYGGYGADASTRVEIGAGERILEQHRINLFRLRGMWLGAPGKP
jgi:neutral ceramidase